MSECWVGGGGDQQTHHLADVVPSEVTFRQMYLLCWRVGAVRAGVAWMEEGFGRGENVVFVRGRSASNFCVG